MRLNFPLAQLLLLLVVVLVALNGWTASAAPRQLPQTGLPVTRRTYSLQVEQLSADPDAAEATPVLVSAVERTLMRLKLRRGHTCASGDWEAGEGVGATLADLTGDANEITFDDNFNPMWYYALRRRGFQHLEWSGCGGKWRPEWSHLSSSSAEETAMDADAAGSDEQRRSADELTAVKHALSHHVVCTFSSVSFCAAARRRAAQSQFQWAAQFVSTLTSSPLSWRSDTPRHIRPTGVLVVAPPRNDSFIDIDPGYADGREGRPLRAPSNLPNVVKTDALLEAEARTQKWCSYHVAYHDTLCTQHISPVLNGGRSGSGVQEVLPPGLFKAVVPSLPLLFGTPFHQFHFRGHQACSGDGEVVLTMTLRMSFVLRREAELATVAHHWSSELPVLMKSATDTQQPEHHGDHRNITKSTELRVVIGPAGIPPILRTSLTSLEGSAVLQNLTRTHVEADRPDAEAAERQVAPASLPTQPEPLGASRGLPWEPEVRYKVAMAGKDHGFYTLEIVPNAVLSAALNVRHQRKGRAPKSTDGKHPGDARPSTQTVRSTSAATALAWRVGDVVGSIVMLPLHLVRPELHSVESLNGSTVLEKAHVDTSANTMALVFRTTLTESHLAAYDEAYRASQQPGATFRQLPGVLLARFPLAHGWAGSRDAPRDADSFRAVPQPVVSLTRCRGGEPARQTASSTAGSVDHSEAIAAVMQILPTTRLSTRSTTMSGETVHGLSSCSVTWLRATMVSGTYIPAPDPAMVFNAFALGLAGFSLGFGAVARMVNHIFSREKDKTSLIGPHCEVEWEWRHQWRQTQAEPVEDVR